MKSILPHLLILLLILNVTKCQNTLSWVRISGSPITINAVTQISFTFYLDLKILKTDKVIITFPSQILITNGSKNCHAVRIPLNRHLLAILLT